jgi:ferredoxin-NADP reductase
MANPDPVKPATTCDMTEEMIDVVVVSRRYVADGILELALARANGAPLPVWEPGAHIDVLLTSGKVRQYSLCGSTSEKAVYVIAVLAVEDGRGGSTEIHSDLTNGSGLLVSRPRNSFALTPVTSAFEFVAGGIGITPILPMIEQVAAKGFRWRLTYACKSSSKMAFRDLLDRYENNVELHYDELAGVFDAQEWARSRNTAAAVYACGPPAMLTALEIVLGDDVDYHSERFAVNNSAGNSRNGFEVVVGSTDTHIQVGPGESILEKLEMAGFAPSFSCRVGVCGACTTVVLDGEVDHRDQVLSADERNTDRKMTICVSRALSNSLVLDL